ncbi:MAG: 4-(cytidine 5'-diphospho)-2-C-methyl-D-erythritol kinase [bacterium]
MELRSYAKINLGLRILRKRPDGYHDIETVFRPIDFFDEISMWQSDENILFSTDNPSLPTDQSNLCVRAAMMLQELTGSHLGVEIRLRKRIPIGAGLGGGSSNAATVLTGLIRLWNLEMTQKELISISGHLGSDVPYFILGKSAYATGKGEQLSMLPLTFPYWIVTVTPSIQVSTVWAYKHCTPSQEGTQVSLRESLLKASGDLSQLDHVLRNDFEHVVYPAFPEIRLLRDSLEALGAFTVHLSGSGSSVFGLFTSESSASQAMQQLSGLHTVTLTRPHFTPVLPD